MFSHVLNLTIFIFIFISPSRWGSTIGTYVIINWGSNLAWLVHDSQIPRICICFDKTIIFLWKGIVIVQANQELKKKKPSSRLPHSKNLELRGLSFLWFQVRILWLLIWWSLETYLIINFRVCGISQDTCKLARTSMLIKIN